MEKHLESKSLKPYKGYTIEKSWEEWPDGSKREIIYTAYDKDGNLFDAAKTLPALKARVDEYIRDKWVVYGEYGGYFSNLKDAKQCAKEASKTEEYHFSASVWNELEGFCYIDYENGKCVRDGWRIKR